LTPDQTPKAEEYLRSALNISLGVLAYCDPGERD